MSVNRPATITIGEHTISNIYWEKWFGIKIDGRLNYNNHLETIIKKASQKVHVLARITPYMWKKNVINERFFQVSVFLLATSMDVPWSFDE